MSELARESSTQRPAQRRPSETATEPLTLGCRHCRSRSGEVVLDLGRQPSCEAFPLSEDRDVEPRYPLRMWFCSDCGLTQLMEDPGLPESPTSVVEPQVMLDQTAHTLDLMDEHGLMAPGSTLAEFGSPHSDSWRDRIEQRGVRLVRPAAPVDVVLDVYGLLHEPDQQRALRRRVDLMGRDGTLVLQLHSLASALRQGQYGELRHGHFAYWSLPALDAALRRLGVGVHRAREFPMDGGTLVLLARRRPDPDPVTRALFDAERAMGTCRARTVGRLQEVADATAGALRSWLVEQHGAGRRVLGYGAASRAVPVLCHAGVDRSLLPAVADASPSKQGRHLPGTGIRVISPARLLELRPDQVLLFLPDLIEEVRRALPQVEELGGRWVSIGTGGRRPEPIPAAVMSR